MVFVVVVVLGKSIYKESYIYRGYAYVNETCFVMVRVTV